MCRLQARAGFYSERASFREWALHAAASDTLSLAADR